MPESFGYIMNNVFILLTEHFDHELCINRMNTKLKKGNYVPEAAGTLEACACSICLVCLPEIC